MELLENLGRKILEKREKDDLGLRAAAKSIGITHSTLSRVERGFHPDLETYQKIYRWLKLPVPTPNEASHSDAPQVHFRRERTVSPELAEALAQMILRAQAAWGLSQPKNE
jgi:transcriptional regulator with XRE-family HTH domain